MKQLNIPNRLSLLRLCLVPVFMALMGIPELLPGQTVMEILFSALAAFVFILCAVTDMIDGKIARKYNMITDFGKFIDPVADKFMVIGAMMMLTGKWTKPGVYTVEEFDPDPYMDALNTCGLPWQVQDDPALVD